MRNKQSIKRIAQDSDSEPSDFDTISIIDLIEPEEGGPVLKRRPPDPLNYDFNPEEMKYHNDMKKEALGLTDIPKAGPYGSVVSRPRESYEEQDFEVANKTGFGGPSVIDVQEDKPPINIRRKTINKNKKVEYSPTSYFDWLYSGKLKRGFGDKMSSQQIELLKLARALENSGYKYESFSLLSLIEKISNDENFIVKKSTDNNTAEYTSISVSNMDILESIERFWNDNQIKEKVNFDEIEADPAKAFAEAVSGGTGIGTDLPKMIVAVFYGTKDGSLEGRDLQDALANQEGLLAALTFGASSYQGYSWRTIVDRETDDARVLRVAKEVSSEIAHKYFDPRTGKISARVQTSSAPKYSHNNKYKWKYWSSVTGRPIDAEWATADKNGVIEAIENRENKGVVIAELDSKGDPSSNWKYAPARTLAEFEGYYKSYSDGGAQSVSTPAPTPATTPAPTPDSSKPKKSTVIKETGGPVAVQKPVKLYYATETGDGPIHSIQKELGVDVDGKFGPITYAAYTKLVGESDIPKDPNIALSKILTKKEVQIPKVPVMIFDDEVLVGYLLAKSGEISDLDLASRIRETDSLSIAESYVSNLNDDAKETLSEMVMTSITGNRAGVETALRILYFTRKEQEAASEVEVETPITEDEELKFKIDLAAGKIYKIVGNSQQEVLRVSPEERSLIMKSIPFKDKMKVQRILKPLVSKASLSDFSGKYGIQLAESKVVKTANHYSASEARKNRLSKIR